MPRQEAGLGSGSLAFLKTLKPMKAFQLESYARRHFSPINPSTLWCHLRKCVSRQKCVHWRRMNLRMENIAKGSEVRGMLKQLAKRFATSVKRMRGDER